MDSRSELKPKVHDPVCGMRFRPEKAAAVIEYGGRTIYFCTTACRRQFEEAPQRYVPMTGSGPNPAGT